MDMRTHIVVCGTSNLVAVVAQEEGSQGWEEVGQWMLVRPEKDIQSHNLMVTRSLDHTIWPHNESDSLDQTNARM